MTDAPKFDTITASVDPVCVPDNRPEPGPMPTMYVVRWWRWDEAVKKWYPKLSMFPRMNTAHWTGEEHVKDEADDIVHKGARRVQIVTIPGDVP